ncbi:helix-turn-helix domain-containing protein [Ruminococcaceae bacterium OttesenSCG-928-L11]|nr:helix-turn-helix domain-containing protein [Ruminococcaceae bacterium OttesenSCG-928-L11]
MSTKTTDELKHEIQAAADIEDYLRNNDENMLRQSLSEHLNGLLEQKGISRADVVRGSLLDRVYVYQIFSGEKTPSRDKLIAIVFGLGLSDEEAQKMLKLSGNRELYPRDERDALILFVLQKQGKIAEVNDLLDSHGLATLGVTDNLR